MEPLLPWQTPSLTAKLENSLPNDIIYSILVWLPVKSLLRFRCVCRDWNSIIRSRAFMLKYSFSRPQGYIFVHFLQAQGPSMASLETQPCTIFSESSLSIVSKLEIEIPSAFVIPSHDPVGCVVVGSCNGLLCITNSKQFGHKLYIWNPSIRKHKILATTSLFTGKFSQRFKHRKTSTVIGLGFDSKTNDYKILRIAYFNWKSRRSKRKPPPQAEVYSLSMDSWRSIAIPDRLTRRFVKINSWNYAYTDGAFHWLAQFANENGEPYSSILRFDLEEEKFREMKLPDDYLNGINCITRRIGVFKGLLSVIINGDNEPRDGKNICYIWLKNGKFWTKQKLSFGGLRWHCGCVGDQLVLAVGQIRVSLFDPQTLEEKDVEIPEPASVHAFTESLALL